MESSSPTKAELRDRIRQQEVVADLGQQALEAGTLDELMGNVTEAVAEALSAEFCHILELLPDGGEFVLREGVGWDVGTVGNATVPTERGSQAGYTLLSKEPVIVDDLPTEDRFTGNDLLVDHDVVRGITVLIGSVKAPWGVLGVFATEQREFTEYDATFVQSVSNVLASAIESEQTESELEEMYGRISDAFFALDEEWRFVHLNEQAHEVINPEGRELVGKHIWEQFPEATERKFKPKYEEAMYEQETVSFEEYYPGPLDAWFEVRAYPSETGLSVYFRDVTERKQRERELVESEQRYRALAEHFPNGLVTLFDTEFEYQLAAGQGFDRIDVDPEDLERRTFREVWDEETADALAPVFEAALDGEGRSVELTYAGREWVVRAVPITDDTGEVFAGMTVAQDITERKERERELVQYETLFEESKDVNVIVDANGAFRYLTPSAANVFGYDPEELVGEVGFEYIHPDDREHAMTEFAKMIESADYEPRIEFRFEHSDGSWIVLEALARDLRDDPDIEGVVIYTRDITERKDRERELERALDLLERTERIADVGGWEIDVDTQKVFWTDHTFELLEVDDDEEPPLEEALGMYHDDDQPVVEDAVETALDSGEAFDVEVRIRTGSGEGRWLRLQGAPETVDGEIVSFRGAAQDITERKEREQRLEELIDRLEESNERLEQFAYAASHDLQEPLRMVSSYLQLIEQRYADALDEDGEEFVEFAVDGADRMRNMIEGLLQYSRVETKGDEFEPVDLEAVLADVCDDLQVRIEETNAEITAEELPVVEGDEGQLRQVFQNLLDNATEYSGDAHPQVHVTAERDGDEWIVSVSDEGVGIDPKDADRIFQVFQSLGGPKDAGTGIGLALCERIIERHGGEIWVDSEPGKGTTFAFTLPAAQEEPQ